MVTGKEGKVKIGTTEIEILSWTLDITQPTQNVSNSGSGTWAEYTSVSFKEWAGSFEGYIESGTTYPIVGNTVSLELIVSPTIKYAGSAIISGEHPSLDVNAVTTLSFDFQGNGALTKTG